MTSDLYKRSLYLNKGIEFLFNNEIIEYDLKSAGFNIVKYYKLLPDKDIDKLEKMDKNQRQIQLGLYQRNNKEFIKQLNDGFANARKLFFEANDIQEYEVLSVKKDAIFIINKHCDYCQFDNLDFRIKNKYLGFMKLNGLEIYYKSPIDDLEIKGLNDNVLEYHKEYMLDFIKDIFALATYPNNKSKIIKTLTQFVKLYIHKELEFGYYRQLNESSKFEINLDGDKYLIDNIDESADYDITYNYFNFILPICRIFI